MKRRELLRNAALVTAFAGTGSLLNPSVARALCASYPSLDRTLVNFMLQGGCDTRFIFMPAPGSLPTAGHESLMWSARQSMYAGGRDGSYVNYEDMFDEEYLPVPAASGHPAFGIYRRCGWLHQQFLAGKVAIVANAVCSKNRRHDQSILNAEAGEPGYGALNQDRDGWGGRLVQETGSIYNSVEIGGSISVFNKGTNPSNRLQQAIHAANSRSISLPDAATGDSTKEGDIITRALKSYYAGRGAEVVGEKPADWPYHRYFNQNNDFRELGSAMQQRVAACGEFPDYLRSNGPDPLVLGSGSFEQQCRNLYDVCQAADILDLRAISMSYGGWDHHGSEETRIGRNLEDIFGLDKGLDRTMRGISAMDSNAADQLVFYFATDFGRQIVTNGDWGTDHGSGLYSILYGNDVAGGVHGEMFPVEETIETGGAIPLQRHGADITGRTSTERILAAIADWVEPGSSGIVVPGAAGSDLEDGVILDLLAP